MSGTFIGQPFARWSITRKGTRGFSWLVEVQSPDSSRWYPSAEGFALDERQAIKSVQAAGEGLPIHDREVSS